LKGYFEDRVSLFAQASLDHVSCFMVSAMVGMTGAHHHIHLFIQLRGDLAKVSLAQVGLEP
jgi:hypothetical protein